MITLDGLRKLLTWKVIGKPLPDGWEQDVREYIRKKRYMIDMLRRYSDKKEMLLVSENALNEAVSIAKYLGVRFDEE